MRKKRECRNLRMKNVAARSRRKRFPWCTSTLIEAFVVPIPQQAHDWWKISKKHIHAKETEMFSMIVKGQLVHVEHKPTSTWKCGHLNRADRWNKKKCMSNLCLPSFGVSDGRTNWHFLEWPIESCLISLMIFLPYALAEGNSASSSGSIGESGFHRWQINLWKHSVWRHSQEKNKH